jgi:hypothetical protein
VQLVGAGLFLGGAGRLGGPALQILRGAGNRANSLLVGGTGLTPAISSEGFYVPRRTASDAQQMLTNGAIDATNTAASSTRPAVALCIGARNNNDVVDLFSQNRLAMFFTAAAMSEAQQLALYNTTQAYMTAVGAAV